MINMLLFRLEANARSGPARIAVEHGNHHRHVGAANRDDDQHAQTNASASIRRKAPLLGGREVQTQSNGGQAQATHSPHAAPCKHHRRAWKERKFVFARKFAKRNHRTEKVMAPMAAPKNNSSGCLWESPRLAIPSPADGIGLGHRSNCNNTAAKPIMLCMNATNSGILVISTRCAMMPTPRHPEHQTQQHPTQADQGPVRRSINAAVVNTAMVMPSMPNTLPRMEVVGCDRPFERLNKTNAGHQIQQRDKVHAHAAPPDWVRGVLSF
jgi:hypothetical protein